MSALTRLRPQRNAYRDGDIVEFVSIDGARRSVLVREKRLDEATGLPGFTGLLVATDRFSDEIGCELGGLDHQIARVA